MKLLVINREGTNGATVELLRDAALKLGVEFVPIDHRRPAPELDPREKILRIAADAFRFSRSLSRTHHCESLERFEYAYARMLALELAGVPLPATERVHELDPDSLREQADRVGDFPLVIKDKIPGGHGAGVVKADNLEALIAIGRLIFETGARKSFLVQRFLPHAQHARLIVLGGKVIDSIAYHSNEYDFRTNRSAAEMNVEPMKFPPEMEGARKRAAAPGAPSGSSSHARAPQPERPQRHSRRV